MTRDSKTRENRNQGRKDVGVPTLVFGNVLGDQVR